MIEKLPNVTLKTSIHLAHGLRSNLFPDGRFRIRPVGEKNGVEFQGVDPNRFAELVTQMKLLIIGHESFDAETGERHDWLATASDEVTSKLGARPDRIWSEIGNRAVKEGNKRAEHLCSAISFQYRAAEISLRRVSDSYFALQRHVHRSKTPAGHRFTTMETFDLYHDLHAYFVNLGSARDYVASYVSEFVTCIGEVSNHAALLRKSKKSKLEIDELIRSYSDRQYNPIGLAQIGEYRDIIVHRSPVGNLSDWVDVIALSKPLPNGSVGVSLKLPANPFELEGSSVDALVLVHHALAFMGRYLVTIANFSPLKPYRPHFQVVDGEVKEVGE